MTTNRELCFVFIGGTHQIYHLAPIAAQIARNASRFAVRCICADEEAETALREIAGQMQAKTMEINRIPISWVAKLAARATGRPSAAKGPILASSKRPPGTVGSRTRPWGHAIMRLERSQSLV